VFFTDLHEYLAMLFLGTGNYFEKFFQRIAGRLADFLSQSLTFAGREILAIEKLPEISVK
jgi:hypothetical protein